MVSLKKFLETSKLQEQLQERLLQVAKETGSNDPTFILGDEAKRVLTSFIQASLENYIAQVYVEGGTFENEDDLRETIEEIVFTLSPETKAVVVENCTDDDAYRLGRTFYNLSKSQLPC